MKVPHLIYPLSADGHWGYFLLGDDMNGTALHIHICVFMQTCVFISLRYVPRRGICESYGNSMFSLLRACKLLSNVAAYSPQQCLSVPILLCSYQHFLKKTLGDQQPK